MRPLDQRVEVLVSVRVLSDGTAEKCRGKEIEAMEGLEKVRRTEGVGTLELEVDSSFHEGRRKGREWGVGFPEDRGP